MLNEEIETMKQMRMILLSYMKVSQKFKEPNKREIKYKLEISEDDLDRALLEMIREVE